MRIMGGKDQVAGARQVRDGRVETRIGEGEGKVVKDEE